MASPSMMRTWRRWPNLIVVPGSPGRSAIRSRPSNDRDTRSRFGDRVSPRIISVRSIGVSCHGLIDKALRNRFRPQGVTAPQLGTASETARAFPKSIEFRECPSWAGKRTSRLSKIDAVQYPASKPRDLPGVAASGCADNPIGFALGREMVERHD